MLNGLFHFDISIMGIKIARSINSCITVLVSFSLSQPPDEIMRYLRQCHCYPYHVLFQSLKVVPFCERSMPEIKLGVKNSFSNGSPPAYDLYAIGGRNALSYCIGSISLRLSANAFYKTMCIKWFVFISATLTASAIPARHSLSESVVKKCSSLKTATGGAKCR